MNPSAGWQELRKQLPAAALDGVEGGRFRQSSPKGSFLHSLGASENDTLTAFLCELRGNEVKKNQFQGSISGLSDSIQFQWFKGIREQKS